jgi:hypothetical protein
LRWKANQNYSIHRCFARMRHAACNKSRTRKKSRRQRAGPTLQAPVSLVRPRTRLLAILSLLAHAGEVFRPCAEEPHWDLGMTLVLALPWIAKSEDCDFPFGGKATMLRRIPCVTFLLLLAASSLWTQTTPSNPPSGSNQQPRPGRQGGQEPCWQVAGIQKSAMEQIWAIERETHSQVETVCSNSSLTPQQKHEQVHQLRDQSRQKVEGLITPEQNKALESCRQQHGWEHQGSHEGGCEGHGQHQGGWQRQGGSQNGGSSSGYQGNGAPANNTSPPPNSSAPQN